MYLIHERLIQIDVYSYNIPVGPGPIIHLKVEGRLSFQVYAYISHCVKIVHVYTVLYRVMIKLSLSL